MAVACVFCEGQFDREIVRQIELSPIAIVEVLRGWAVAVTRLGNIGKITCGVTKVSRGVIRVTQRETPIAIERFANANGQRRNGFHDRR